MSSFEISLTPQQRDDLGKNCADLASYFISLFEPASVNYRQLMLELQREFRHNGSPDVRCITFDRAFYNPATNTGSCRIVLDIIFSFGCEDSITEKRGQTSEWTFTQIGSIIRFYSSPFAESRTTADEF